MKNTFSFPHEYGARNDPKIQDIIFACGGEAGFAWWVIVEMLHEQGGYLPRNYLDKIAYAAHCSVDTVKYVVEKSGLLKFDEERIWSEKVLFQLSEKDKRSENAKTSSAARWDKYKVDKQKSLLNNSEIQPQCERNANAIQPQCERNAINEYNINEININKDTKVSMSEKISDPEESQEEKHLFLQESSGETNNEQEILSNKQCQQVVDFWNKTIKEKGADFPKVVSLSEDRKKKIRIRWAEFSKIEDPIEVTRKLFARACESKFLQGDNNNGWSASFDWIFTNSKNWVKIYEGNYDNKTGSGKKIDTGKDIDALWEYQ